MEGNFSVPCSLRPPLCTFVRSRLWLRWKNHGAWLAWHFPSSENAGSRGSSALCFLLNISKHSLNTGNSSTWLHPLLQHNSIQIHTGFQPNKLTSDFLEEGRYYQEEGSDTDTHVEGVRHTDKPSPKVWAFFHQEIHISGLRLSPVRNKLGILTKPYS